MSRRWLRYSLRSLLVLMTLIGVGSYWLMRPTMKARRFVEAINSGDYTVATALCLDPERAFPGDWPQQHQYFAPRAGVGEWTWQDLLQGRRPIYVAISYGDDGGIASGGVECRATREGIEVGMYIP